VNVLDLFTGAGGWSLGLERAGFRTVAMCERDEYCRAVLRKHWPDVPCYDDVRTLTADRLAADGIAPDVIAAGWPCQDISYAGKGAGLAGERSGLWREVARLVGSIRPRLVLLENVAALLSRGLGDVLGDLAALGYDAEWYCVGAAQMGAPHRRLRIWIVAYPQRDQQSRPEPRYGAIGRMGRQQQSVPWDRDWQGALREFRGMDDGLSYGVERTDTMRNALCPTIAEAIGRIVMQADEATGAGISKKIGQGY
jgi:DNA-cytosine methyltransferase